jgi:hypothetical protein
MTERAMSKIPAKRESKPAVPLVAPVGGTMQRGNGQGSAVRQTSPLVLVAAAAAVLGVLMALKRR